MGDERSMQYRVPRTNLAAEVSLISGLKFGGPWPIIINLPYLTSWFLGQVEQRYLCIALVLTKPQAYSRVPREQILSVFTT
jgi:hypothetical protein